MKRFIQRAAIVAAMGSGLAACGGNSSNAIAPTTAPTPPITVTRQEDQFGTNFGTAYRTSVTAAPITPADGDIIPLSLTTNPVNVG